MKMPRDTVRFGQLFALTVIASTVLSLASRLPADGPSIFDCDNPDACTALDGPVTCADGRRVTAPFHCNDLCQNLPQDIGKLCATFDGNLCVEAVCGNAGECGNAQFYVPPSCDDHSDCTTDTCNACGNNCAGTCVHQLVEGLVTGPVTCADGRHVSAPFHCNDLCENPSQNTGKHCATFDDNLCIEAVCGSAGECGNAKAYVPASCGDGDTCTIDTCDVCANNRSGACVHQQNVDTPDCNRPPGDACSGNFQCASTFCADGVCCNRACDNPFETCNQPGRVGLCTAPAGAPLLSARGVVIISCVLAAIGLLGLWRAAKHPA